MGTSITSLSANEFTVLRLVALSAAKTQNFQTVHSALAAEMVGPPTQPEVIEILGTLEEKGFLYSEKSETIRVTIGKRSHPSRVYTATVSVALIKDKKMN